MLNLYLTTNNCTKLKSFVTKMIISISDGGKHCGKRRKCWLPAFSPFLTMFSNALFFSQGMEKSGLCGTDLNDNGRYSLIETHDMAAKSAEQDQTACMYRLILLCTLRKIYPWSRTADNG